MGILKKELNQLYGAVGTVERLGTILERAKRIQKSLLNLMQGRRTQVPYLIAMKLIIHNMMLVVPRKSGRLGGLAVSVI